RSAWASGGDGSVWFLFNVGGNGRGYYRFIFRATVEVECGGAALNHVSSFYSVANSYCLRAIARITPCFLFYHRQSRLYFNAFGVVFCRLTAKNEERRRRWCAATGRLELENYIGAFASVGAYAVGRH